MRSAKGPEKDSLKWKGFCSGKDRAPAGRLLACVSLLAMLSCSCFWWEEVITAPPVEEAVVEEIPEEEISEARQWIVTQISPRLEDALKEKVVHVTADDELRLYTETWGEKIKHVDVFFSEYVLRLPIEEIEAYPVASMEEQIETGQIGPALLKNGWRVWVGYIERKDAISHDLSISARETCEQLSKSGEARRARAVRQVFKDFQEGFVFRDDLELFRWLWHSPFESDDAASLEVEEAVAMLFLADLKRLLAPPMAPGHVAEVETEWMRGFEFGDETSEHGYSAELFDERNHVTALFLPPGPPGESLDEGFREKALASIRRHGRWAPGYEMIKAAERVLESNDLENGRDICTLLLFSALQFPDHKTRAARMLVKLYPEGTSEADNITKVVEALIGGE